MPARNRTKLVIALGLLLALLGGWLARPLWRRPNPLLETPVLALENLQAKTVYFNAQARPWLLAHRPDLIAAELRDGQTERTRAFAQAVLVPKLFRQLDRESRFDAVVLTGDPSQFRPLLDHLVEKKDWSLAYVDHTTLVFRREGVPPWKLEDLQPVRTRFAGATAHDRAVFLAQTGGKLVAVKEFAAAKQVLDEAVRTDASLPEAWSALAIYHMQRGEYREAFADADRALALDGKNLAAMAAKTQLLYGTKQFSEAYTLSKALIERLPDEPNLLFYHAKIAHEAQAFQAEISTLEKLIARAEAEERPVSGYLLYLAQAYTTVGDGTRAIDAFMKVLNDPDLPQDQRDFARENIARIKKRTGL